MIYGLNPSEGILTPHQPAFVETMHGAGPRHLTFHPNGRFVYVINEMKCTISAFRYNATRGNLESLQDISTLPTGFSGENTAAEVQVHPSGRFLYGSNRGHDSIAVFAVEPKTGRLAVSVTNPPWVRRRGTSSSILADAACWLPIKTAVRSSFSGLIPSPACSTRPGYPSTSQCPFAW